jgi:hypothetical protein
MFAEAEVPLLVISGTVGVGKSIVLDEIHDVLRAAELPHACIDADALGLSWPTRGAFNQVTVADNVASMWANFRAAGARRLVIAGVVERAEDLAAYQRAVPGARIALCELRASEQTRIARLRTREMGGGLEWHIRRTSELQTILDDAALCDFVVSNDGRNVRDVALEVLIRAGWLPEPNA